MKTWVIGDIHGKIDVVNKVLASSEPDKIIFVGDFLDSFALNIQDQINIIDRVLHEVKADGKVSCILGNHELSYIDNKKYGCSGYMHSTQAHMLTRNTDILKYFDRCLLIDDFLVTHAGVSNNWLPKDIERTAESINKFVNESNLDDLMQVGHSRGGYFPAGGPFWCDFWADFKPIPNVKQIFGHSAYRPSTSKGIVQVEENYNIDCLDHVQEVLELEDGKVRFIGL